jgi:uncharacterized membrane protein
MKSESQQLPSHVEETIGSHARLHADRSREVSAFQRAVARLTRALGRPAFLLAVMVAIAGWAGLNLVLLQGGVRPLDPPPFSWLQGTVSGLALIMTILILSTQQRNDRIGDHRAQLTLQLALLSEKKLAKLVELLEDLRRDDPHIADRADPQAAAMSVPADPHAVSEAIKKKVEPAGS